LVIFCVQQDDEIEQGCTAVFIPPIKKKAQKLNSVKCLEKANINVDRAKPKDLVKIKVDIDPVMDLTNIKKSLISPGSPFLTGNESEDLENCHVLADTIRDQGFAGIIAPSAALEGEKNLIIYIDGPAGKINLDESGTRKKLEL